MQSRLSRFLKFLTRQGYDLVEVRSDTEKVFGRGNVQLQVFWGTQLPCKLEDVTVTCGSETKIISLLEEVDWSDELKTLVSPPESRSQQALRAMFFASDSVVSYA